MDKYNLALELYRHCDDLERYAAYVSDLSADYFDDTNEKIFNLIYRIAGERIADNYKSQRKLDELREKIADIRTNAADEILKLLREESDGLIEVESAFIFAFFAALFGSTGKNISVETAENIAKYGRYRGLSRREIIKKLLAGDIQRIYETVSGGLGDNLPADELIELVKKQLNTTRRFLRSEVDVIVNGIVNDVALAFAAKNKLRLMWSSMMDDRVCPECRRDGETWGYDDPDIPSLPRHINCRCRLLPFSDGDKVDAADFGITFAEYFNSLDAKEKKKRIGSAMYKGVVSGSEKVSKFIEPPASAFLTIEDVAERDSNFILQS